MKIVFLEPLGVSVESIENECKVLKDLGHEVVIYHDRCPEKNIERSADADIVVQSNMPLRKDYFDACPNLKMLSIAFTGLDHIDLAECERRGIVVNNAAGYSTEAVAEEVICMMIGLYRHVIENDKITRDCAGSAMSPGREISGKTVGVIGLGTIGQRTAKLAKAFGCKVIAWNRTPKEIEGINVTGTKITKNIIIVPIDNSLLYVEPIYQTQLNEKNAETEFLNRLAAQYGYTDVKKFQADYEKNTPAVQSRNIKS